MWETLEFPGGDELWARLDAAELVLPPGADFHYSLFGEVVARVSGVPFTQFVDERLIGPLGLERTTWQPVEPAATGYYVDPYARTLRREPDLEGDGTAAVGGLWSTPSDLCRWAHHLASLEALHQLQVMEDAEGWTLGRGLGLQLIRQGDRVCCGSCATKPAAR